MAISFWVVSIAMVASTCSFLMESTSVGDHWKTIPRRTFREGHGIQFPDGHSGKGMEYNSPTDIPGGAWNTIPRRTFREGHGIQFPDGHTGKGLPKTVLAVAPGQARARQGRPGQGRAGQGKAGQARAGQGKPEQARAG